VKESDDDWELLSLTQARQGRHRRHQQGFFYFPCVCAMMVMV
jgi:hypothetical protein